MEKAEKNSIINDLRDERIYYKKQLDKATANNNENLVLFYEGKICGIHAAERAILRRYEPYKLETDPKMAPVGKQLKEYFQRQ